MPALGRSGILGWLWRPDREEISSQQAEVKLRENAHGMVRQIRKRLWAMPHINAARAGVIVHVGIVIGAETLLHNDALWRALQVADYERLRTRYFGRGWPSLAGDDEHARARVLALARQLRPASCGAAVTLQEAGALCAVALLTGAVAGYHLAKGDGPAPEVIAAAPEVRQADGSLVLGARP